MGNKFQTSNENPIFCYKTRSLTEVLVNSKCLVHVLVLLIISGEQGAGHSSKSSMIVMYVVLVTAMAPQIAYIVNRKKTSA